MAVKEIYNILEHILWLVPWLCVVPMKMHHFLSAFNISYILTVLRNSTDLPISVKKHFISFSPLNEIFLQRCRGQLAVSGAEPADCYYLQGAPSPSLPVWCQHQQSLGAGVCCWSAGWPTCLQTQIQNKVTHMQELACLNTTDIHTLSKTLKPKDKEHMQTRLTCMAVKQRWCKRPTFFLADKKADTLTYQGVLKY